MLLDTAGVPKLTDFGLAKRLDEEAAAMTGSGMVLGTPSYMAPEQAQGKIHEISPATDVYSLGALLYECLTGRPPFQAATVIETLMQVMEKTPEPPSRWEPRIPAALDAICLQCLQKNPAQRYPSAEALAESLHRFLEGSPLEARAARARPAPAARARRRWWPFG